MKIAPTTVSDANIRVETYDIEAMREVFPGWDQLPKHQRHRLVKCAGDPLTVERVSNVTCDALHEYYADVLTLETSDGKNLDPPHEIAFGDDTSSFSTSDTSMNNEVGDRITITDATSSSKDTNFDEYLSSNEQNGNTLSEIGVFSEDGEMYQHAALSTSYNKDSGFALSINITISHADA